MRRPPLDVRSLAGAPQVLRVAGGVRHDPRVQAWLDGEPRALRALARAWFARMREQGDDVRELLHDGCPVACVEDVPFGYVNTFTRHANVGFFQGAFLPDPAGLLRGQGKRMRHVTLTPDRAADAAALAALIEAAHAQVRTLLLGPDGPGRTPAL